MLFFGGRGGGVVFGFVFFNHTEEQDVWSSLKEGMNKEYLFVHFSYILCFGFFGGGSQPQPQLTYFHAHQANGNKGKQCQTLNSLFN